MQADILSTAKEKYMAKILADKDVRKLLGTSSAFKVTISG
jgi:hypothetical protein